MALGFTVLRRLLSTAYRLKANSKSSGRACAAFGQKLTARILWTGMP